MPDIALLVGQPRITFTDSKFLTNGWHLAYRATLAQSWRQRIELVSGDDFKQLDGWVGFQDSEAAEPYLGHQKGTLYFSKGSDAQFYERGPSYTSTIRLPAADLQRLLRTIASGTPLKSVNIEVPIDYGWEPDGSGKKWDNVTTPAVEIEGFQLFFGEPENEEIIPDRPEDAIESDEKSLKKLREIAQASRLTLYAVLALGIAILWFK